MFVAHYAPALAVKPAVQRTPLWHFFIAVQLLDFLWAGFILTGIEHARIVPGFLAASNLDLYDMPLTHSLAGALAWSVGAALAYRFVIRPSAGWGGSSAIGAAVFSHWILDFLVHAPDLALYPGSPIKLGLGLWNSILFSQGLEAGLLLVGLGIYVAATKPKGPQGRIALWTLVAVFAALQAYILLAPPPAAISGVAYMALAAYSLFAASAFWLDRTRTARNA